ncbi:MAG: signal peptidase I [Planctomycetaceae bacterium]|nr:signal peptidase I [Planctomycetaceae bacterium]
MTEAAIWLVVLLTLVVASSVALWRSGSGRYRPPSFLLAMAAVLAQLAASAVIVVGACWAYQRFSPAWYVPVLAATVGCVVVWFVLLMVVLRFTLTETVRAALAAGVASGCVLGFAVIPLLVIYRTYEVPTNAMAPTLLGRHFVGRCPNCGGRAVVSFSEVIGQKLPAEAGICARCLQVRPVEHVEERASAGDRIFVRRLATPRRWDIVVFLSPGEGPQLYAMRLVGLPGESVEVKEGGVWINGVRQQPPAEIAGLRWYLPDGAGTPQFATERNPTPLAANEYFVLGDYSPSSYDSRFWGPVKGEDLRGVVSAVYWPPRSARILPRH